MVKVQAAYQKQKMITSGTTNANKKCNVFEIWPCGIEILHIKRELLLYLYRLFSNDYFQKCQTNQ